MHHFNQVAQPQMRSVTQTSGIRMEVVFGTPSQNCIGSGICMIMNRFPVGQQLRCPHAPAWINYEQGQLVFRFLKAETFREDAKVRLSSPWFLILESFQLPRHCARQLGLPAHWVSPGLYKVIEGPQDWVLKFQL